MKCLSAMEPVATLMVKGLKLVENRTRPTSHRGDLLIHASRGQEWMKRAYNHPVFRPLCPPIAELKFGYIVGIVEIYDCLEMADAIGIVAEDQRVWVLGPWCYLLRNCRRFTSPIPYSGKLGVFEVPDIVVRDAA